MRRTIIVGLLLGLSGVLAIGCGGASKSDANSSNDSKDSSGANSDSNSTAKGSSGRATLHFHMTGVQ